MGGKHWREIAKSLGKTELEYLQTIAPREALHDQARVRLHELELEALSQQKHEPKRSS